MIYEIDYVCDRANSIKWQSGTICGIYRHCFNIVTDGGELITVFNNKQKFSTRAYICDCGTDFCGIELENGDKAVKKNNGIFVGNIAFIANSPKIISVHRKKLKKSGDVPRNIIKFYCLLKELGKNSPIITEKIYTQKLLRGLMKMQKNETEGFESLIGLGVGLTPSCDDIISGIAAWNYLLYGYTGFNEKLTEFLKLKGDVKTTTVSKNLLIDVAEGYINSSLYELINSICGDGNKLKALTYELAEYGSTSGIETCYGILFGYSMANNEELIKWL